MVSARARFTATVLAILACMAFTATAHAKLLVPMDEAQTDHLKAYGLTYWVLGQGQKGEWLLNYRGGSFLFADDPAIQREADLRGVAIEPMGVTRNSDSVMAKAYQIAIACSISARA